MAIIKQGSGHQRHWSDWLPNVVCVAALLTLISAAAAGFLSQRVTILAYAQKVRQEQTDTSSSQALSKAKAQWQKKEVELGKELLSAKLKIKAEQTTSANIRKRLVKTQKDLEALKKIAGVQAVKTSAPAAPKTTTAVAQKKASPTTAAPAAAPATAAPVAAAPKAQPQTTTEAPPVSPPAPTPAEAANVPASAAPKTSQPPAAPAVQPVELAPPAKATETPIAEESVAEENAPGATE